MAKPTMSSGDKAEHDSFVESQRLPLFHLDPLLVQTLQVFIFDSSCGMVAQGTLPCFKDLLSLLTYIST